MKSLNEIVAELSKPFPRKDVKTRSQSNKTLWFISADQAQERLNKVCPGNWSSEMEVISEGVEEREGKNGPATWYRFDCRASISISSQEEYVKRTGVGSAANPDRDTALKAAFSESFKIAAKQYGIGLELYTEARRIFLEALGNYEYMERDVLVKCLTAAARDYGMRKDIPTKDMKILVPLFLTEAGEDPDEFRKLAKPPVKAEQKKPERKDADNAQAVTPEQEMVELGILPID
jgi:hypothetical protein